MLPLIKVDFLGKEIYIPNNPSKLLECYYGKKYIIPDHECNKECTICKKITKAV